MAGACILHGAGADTSGYLRECNKAKMIWLVILWGLTAAALEAWNDRKGETKKDKIADGVYLAIATSCLCLLVWVLDRTNPLKVIAVVLGVRLLFFDYLTHALLKRFSESHKDINIWTYVGKTSFTDRNILSRIHWRIVLLARVLIFVAALVLYTGWR